LTTPTKTVNQFYVRVDTDRELSRDLVKQLYSAIKSILPTGLPSSVALESPSDGVIPVRLIHTVTTAGAHQYEIPLTRHLTDNEFEFLVDSLLVPDDFTIIKSAAPIQDWRQKPTGPTQLAPDEYEVFCDTLAKRQHARWCEERTANGWRYGPTHSAGDRVSPLLRPWHDLPEQYRKVDRVFPEEIINIIEEMGFVIVPKTELTKLTKKK